LTAGASPIELKRGMDKAVEAIVCNLYEMSIPISKKDDIENIATISANGDKAIGQLISTAVDAIGKDGAITIEPARSIETSLEVVEGFKFSSGYLSTSFLTDDRRRTVNYNDCYLLITDFSITAVDDLLPVLEVVAREAKPLVVVAENVEGQALAALIMNAMRGTLKVAAIKAPMYGESRRNMLNDIALSTGATFITRQAGKRLKDVKLVDLGQCQSIEVTKTDTTIVGTTADYDKVEERIQQLKEELSATSSLDDCERIQERITRLASGVAIIRVGAATEIEMVEKKHRMEDALEAVRSAQQEGIVPGGGVALLRAASEIKVSVDNEQQQLGVEIIKKAIAEPLRQMAINAGESPDIILAKVTEVDGAQGYNFATQEIENMIDSGVLDPAKVTRSALQNATSVASTLITTSHAIIEAN
jgi:chaperonin GroEL